jgi:hypothetical protein
MQHGESVRRVAMALGETYRVPYDPGRTRGASGCAQANLAALG